MLSRRLPGRASWRFENHLEARRRRRNLRIRPHPPARHARGNAQARPDTRPYRPLHYRLSPLSPFHPTHPLRRPTATPRGAAQYRRLRHHRRAGPFTKGMGILLLRRRRPIHQDPQQHRLQADSPPSPHLPGCARRRHQHDALRRP